MSYDFGPVHNTNIMALPIRHARFILSSLLLLICFTADEGVAMPCPFLGQYTYTDKGSLCRGEFKIGCKNVNEVIIETECPGNQRSGMHYVVFCDRISLCPSPFVPLPNVFVIGIQLLISISHLVF